MHFNTKIQNSPKLSLGKRHTSELRSDISAFYFHVNDTTEQNLARAPYSLPLTLLNLRKCFVGKPTCVCAFVVVCAGVSGCHVAPSDSALLCQEIRTQCKPLAVPAYWISPLNLLCWKL